ncbi:MAG: SPOR domain-containing protein [Pseudooceanicola sp.]
MFQGNSLTSGAVRVSTSRGLRALTAVTLTMGLTACVDGGDFPLFQAEKPTEGVEDVSTRRATRLIERDVEAPDVFQATEAGLWDGRPSLGGVWVAHPDVKDPERVLIRNTANGKFVIGALFRRERENPGPRLQVSSDTAAALGMLAGAPQNLNVTALRREEVPTAPEATAQALPPADKVEEKALDPIASAASAIDKAEGKPAKETKAAAKKVSEITPAAVTPLATAAETATAAAATAGDPLTDANVQATAEMAPEPKKSNFFSKLFGKKQPKEPAAPLSAMGPVDAAAAPPVQTLAIAPAAKATAPAKVQKASVPPASAPKPPRASSLRKPYLQIGIFSVEQNAKNTATAMRQAGMIPTVRKQSSKGKVFWRVLIGPANTSTEQASLLKKVKGEGFTDAYAVTN